MIWFCLSLKIQKFFLITTFINKRFNWLDGSNFFEFLNLFLLFIFSLNSLFQAIYFRLHWLYTSKIFNFSLHCKCIFITIVNMGCCSSFKGAYFFKFHQIHFILSTYLFAIYFFVFILIRNIGIRNNWLS